MNSVPRITAFDPTKKSHWLLADINGLLYTWFALAMLMLLGAVIFGTAQRMSWKVMLGVPAAVAFVIVFVLRRNFTVIWGRRELRYICRWL